MCVHVRVHMHVCGGAHEEYIRTSVWVFTEGRGQL